MSDLSNVKLLNQRSLPKCWEFMFLKQEEFTRYMYLIIGLVKLYDNFVLTFIMKSTLLCLEPTKLYAFVSFYK